MKKSIWFFVIIFFSLSKLNAQDSNDTRNSQLEDTTRMSKELGEIVIKASKDNVTHKTIPASVSVISSDLIKDNEIKTLNEISGTAANFY
ncbi:MAG TPA: hypothetical protein VHO68_00705, partial [Bacteroidales bacterium]|nr:hypothetical protein [Bacteroidales bacterium]